MIVGLQGKINEILPSSISLDVNGVLYEIFVPLSIFSQLTIKEGADVFLHTHHHFSESSQKLFGFSTRSSREFFIALQSIKGLGPSLALSLLSHFSPTQLIEICSLKNDKALTHIPKIGKATAERLVFEINRRQKKWNELLSLELAQSRGEKDTGSAGMQKFDLAGQALIQLGYKETEAIKTLEKYKETLEADKIENTNTSDIIAACLRLL